MPSRRDPSRDPSLAGRRWDESSPAGVPARLSPSPKLQKERE
jgi:hypothetical protein